MKFIFCRLFLLFVVGWNCFCATNAMDIREVAKKLTFLKGVTWGDFTPDESSYIRWIHNIIEGIKAGADRHISLVIIEALREDGIGMEIPLPYVFVSGQVREKVRQDIVGAVARPNSEDFWKVFKDIGSSGFSCDAAQTQSLAHSERAACLWVLSDMKNISSSVGYKIKNLTLHIFNVKAACSSCEAFLRGESKIGKGKFEKSSGTPIIQALKEKYSVTGTVKIIVYSLEEKPIEF